jgi:hypothetical protein
MTEIIGIKTKFLFYAGIPLVSRQAEDSVCYFGLRSMESPTTRGAGGLDFSAIGGEKQRHGSAVIGAGGTGCKAPGLKTPNHKPAPSIKTLKFVSDVSILKARTQGRRRACLFF